MKPALRQFIILLLILISCSPAAFARRIEVYFNGQRLSLDTPPKEVQGTTYASIGRNGLFDWIEATARYDPADAGITIRRSGQSLIMHLGQRKARLGNVEKTMPAAPLSLAGRIYVPLKFTCEALGLFVRSDSAAAAIHISSVAASIAPAAPIPPTRSNQPAATSTISQKGWQNGIPWENSPPQAPPPAQPQSAQSPLAQPPPGEPPVLKAPLLSGLPPIAPPVSRPLISDISHDARGILTPGKSLKVTLKGTPTCQAFFGIEGLVQGIPMQELQTGQYQGNLDIVEGPSIKDAKVIGYLFQGNVQSPPMTSSETVSIQGFVSKSLREVTHNAKHPLSTGQTLDVTLTAKPGGQASFDIGTVKTGLPMNEDNENPGRYTGSYTIQPNDIAQNAPVIGHFKLPGGELESQETMSLVTINTESFPMDVAFPTDNTTVRNPMEVTGQTLPGARVTVYVIPQVGIFPQLINMGGDVCTTVVNSDQSGQFRASCQLPMASPGIEYKVKVWAQDSNGKKSPTRYFTVVTQRDF